MSALTLQIQFSFNRIVGDQLVQLLDFGDAEKVATDGLKKEDTHIRVKLPFKIICRR